MFRVEFTETPEAKILQDLIDERQQILDRAAELTRAISEQAVKADQEKREIREKLLAEAKQRELEKQLQEEQDKLKAIEDTIHRIKELTPVTWEHLRPYQQESTAQAFHNLSVGHSGFFNADDMGLGKTLQAIAMCDLYLAEHPDEKVLWLSKSSIVETGGTKREFQRWSEIPIIEILGRSPKKERGFMIDLISKMAGIVLITNYETMRTTPELKNTRFGMVVMDEVHKLKGGANPSGPTGLWVAIKEYIRDMGPDFIYMLSGTPMVNRVAELWAYLHIFDPSKFDNLRSFESAFNAYQEFGGKIDTERILNVCLADRMVRRTRNEVGIQLPELTIVEQTVEYNPQQQKAYDQMKDNFYIWLDEQEDAALTATAIIAQLTRLRQISVWPVFSQIVKDEWGNDKVLEVNVPDSAKVDEAMDIIEEHNDQVVVFCNFNSVFEEIQKRCNKLGLTCRFITGKTKADMGSAEIDFQQGKIDVLCINSSMGEGLNLQKNPDRWPGGASVGIHLDRWWNPARDEQCNARIYRMGANQPVTIYFIHAPKSVDDFVAMISDEKAEMFEGIMKGDQIRPAGVWKEMLRDIL